METPQNLEFKQEDYVDFLEEELARQWDTIGAAQEFFIFFGDFLEFLQDNVDETEDAKIHIKSDLIYDIFEKHLEKCANSLEDFQEKRGSLMNLDD